MFFRDYCNDLKISDNNTEFLLNFNEFIDRKTPNNPSCKYEIIVPLCLYSKWSNLGSVQFVAMLVYLFTF